MPSAQVPRPRVLLVDDDRAVLAVLKHGLECGGVDVVTAGDGASALRSLVDHLLELDLLVTDLAMPGLDGPSLVRIIRAEGGEHELAIMVLASSVGARDRELLAGLGVTEILAKRDGAEHAVRRVIELATAARDRRVRLDQGVEAASTPLATVRLVRVSEPA